MGRNRGLTLIELLVTLAVLVTMVTLGVPQLKNLINSNRRTTQINDLVTALNLARSEAAKRGNFANVCASDGGITCSGVNTWETGWIVYSDNNNDGAKALVGEPVLRAFAAINGGTLLASDNAIPSNPIVSIVYSTDGSRSPAGAAAATFTRCDNSGTSDPRAVIVGANGIVNTSDTNAGGGNLTCP